VGDWLGVVLLRLLRLGVLGDLRLQFHLHRPYADLLEGGNREEALR
jgi:hypothetical protein